MQELFVDQNIAVAKCLSPEFYRSDEYFEKSKELIFSKAWQYAGQRDQVDNMLPVTLLKGFLDEPLLLTESNGLNCLSNVCTHRGNLLVDEGCHGEGIRCRYHGRKFDLNGKFLSMPEFEGVRDFPSESDDLPRLEIEKQAGQLFVSIDPVAEFERFFEPLLDIFSVIPEPERVFTKTYELNAHWALYCENYLEGFHIPFVHKSLNAELEYDTYKTSTHRYSSLQTATARKTGLIVGAIGEYGGMFRESAVFYYFVFPNLMFNFYPWGLSINVVEPVAKDHTVIRYISIITDSAELERGAGSDLETVELEDQKVVRSVQKGINSRLYKAGRYSVKREIGTHHFHRLIAEFMNAVG